MQEACAATCRPVLNDHGNESIRLKGFHKHVEALNPRSAAERAS